MIPIRKFSLYILAALLLMMTVVPVLADGVTVTAYTSVRVRSGPGTTYTVIGRLFAGDVVQVTGRDSKNNDWLRITFRDGEGWVAASVVSLNGDPSTLEVVGSSNAQTTVGNTGVTATAIGTVNVRFGPGTSYRAIGTTTDGQVFDVIGRSRIDRPLICRDNHVIDVSGVDSISNVWVQVNYNGFPAWVNYSVVSVSGDLCGVAVPDTTTTTPAPIQTLLNQALVITKENTNLRASEYAQSDVLAVIPYSTTLVADARNSDSTRIHVTYQDQTGWVSFSLLDVASGNIDNLPIQQD